MIVIFSWVLFLFNLFVFHSALLFCEEMVKMMSCRNWSLCGSTSGKNSLGLVIPSCSPVTRDRNLAKCAQRSRQRRWLVKNKLQTFWVFFYMLHMLQTAMFWCCLFFCFLKSLPLTQIPGGKPNYSRWLFHSKPVKPIQFFHGPSKRTSCVRAIQFFHGSFKRTNRASRCWTYLLHGWWWICLCTRNSRGKSILHWFLSGAL